MVQDGRRARFLTTLDLVLRHDRSEAVLRPLRGLYRLPEDRLGPVRYGGGT